MKLEINLVNDTYIWKGRTNLEKESIRLEIMQTWIIKGGNDSVQGYGCSHYLSIPYTRNGRYVVTANYLLL